MTKYILIKLPKLFDVSKLDGINVDIEDMKISSNNNITVSTDMSLSDECKKSARILRNKKSITKCGETPFSAFIQINEHVVEKIISKKKSSKKDRS